jgi:hypothetical protein
MRDVYRRGYGGGSKGHRIPDPNPQHRIKVILTQRLLQSCRKYGETSRITDQRVANSNVNDIETKGQTFRYRSLLSERKQNILVWSAYYRNESKTY